MATTSINEGTVLWEPSEEQIGKANLTRYLNWLKAEKGLEIDGYQSLWDWSVNEIEDFWQSLWEFFQIKSSTSYSRVLSQRSMPGAKWFSGAELNYAEHVFRNMSSERPALIFQSEIQPLMEISWDELHQKVSAVATALRDMGVQSGDRVVSYMPNIPQTIIAFLACASIGAIWSSCSPDFGTRSVTDRFNQIKPKVLFAVDGYQYGGRAFDSSAAIAKLQQSLSSLEHTVLVPYLKSDAGTQGMENCDMGRAHGSRRRSGF